MALREEEAAAQREAKAAQQAEARSCQGFLYPEPQNPAECCWVSGLEGSRLKHCMKAVEAPCRGGRGYISFGILGGGFCLAQSMH